MVTPIPIVLTAMFATLAILTYKIPSKLANIIPQTNISDTHKKTLKKLAISGAVVALVLVTISLALIGTLLTFTGKFRPTATPYACTYSVEDDADEVTSGNNAIDIIMTSGDGVPLNNLRILIYKTTDNSLVANIVVKNGLENNQLNFTDATGVNDGIFNPGDKLIITTSVINQAGGYRVKLVDMTSGNILADQIVHVE